LPFVHGDVDARAVGGLPQQAGIGDGDHAELGVVAMNLQQDLRADPGRFARRNDQ
jgi:hypothetical protein